MLIVYRLDRISRSIGDFTALIERLVQLNVAFVSIREQFDTSTPMGRAVMYIASVFSQLERETIAERIRDNLRGLAKTGRWLGGITPTGFAPRPCRPSLSTGEQSAPAACGFFRRRRRPSGHVQPVRTPRLSDSRCKGLQERGITTKTATRSRAMPCAISHNPVYARADADMLAWLRNAGAEPFAAQEEFDGRHGVLAYHRTDQSRWPHRCRPAAGGWIVAVGQHLASSPAQWAAAGAAPADGLPHAAYGARDACPVSRSAAVPLRQTDVCQVPLRGRRRALFPMSAVRNRPADGNNAAARTSLALQQTPPCAPCSAPCRRPCRAGSRPAHAAARPAGVLPCAAGLRIPTLRDCLTPSRRTQRVLEALTEQLRWDGETLCVTLRRVDCK